MSYDPDVGEWVRARWVLGRTMPGRVVSHRRRDGDDVYLIEFADADRGEIKSTRYYRDASLISAYDPLPAPIEVGSRWMVDGSLVEITGVTILEDGRANVAMSHEHVDVETFIERVALGEITHDATAHAAGHDS